MLVYNSNEDGYFNKMRRSGLWLVVAGSFSSVGAIRLYQDSITSVSSDDPIIYLSPDRITSSAVSNKILDLQHKQTFTLEQIVRLNGGSYVEGRQQQQNYLGDSSTFSTMTTVISRIFLLLKETIAFRNEFSKQSVPSLLAAFLSYGICSISEKNDISVLELYVFSLLGSSCGFHLFLHFITLGYAAAVSFQIAFALFFYSVRTFIMNPRHPFPT